MRRILVLCVLAGVVLCPSVMQGQSPAPSTDLDRFMATALQRRDIDRKTLSDYVLDEAELFEVLGPGRVPVARMRREYTWYVRDGIHVRSPLKFDGVPIPEPERRAYEERWIKSEEGRRKFRTERAEKRAQSGKPPAVSVPSINEPRFISESYFMDFKFEPGNYYLAGHESIDGHDVLKIDYLPAKLFQDDHENRPRRANRDRTTSTEDAAEEAVGRKMDKTSQVTLWVDPATHQIVKYTFDNVWMDFLPGGWIVKVDDLSASMEMGQPFPAVWLPHNLSMHGGVSLALGPMEFSYKREFANYRKADVSSKIKVPR